MSRIAGIVVLVIFVLFGCSDDQKLRILAIGDSNGASSHGWVSQLSAIAPNHQIVNVSVSGNTVGFDNLDNPALNALRNTDRYLEEAYSKFEELDVILIMLGTNDSKAVFAERIGEVPDSLISLVQNLKEKVGMRQPDEPAILVLSPPPYGPDGILAEKYKGAGKRVEFLNSAISAVADSLGWIFIDTQHMFPGGIMSYSNDGVHLDSTAQRTIASSIVQSLRKLSSN
jgi:lysophospholipase L1-like esterase